VRVLDLGGDLVGEEAATNAVTAGMMKIAPATSPKPARSPAPRAAHAAASACRAGDAFEIAAPSPAARRTAAAADAEHDQQQDREPDRFQQHRAETAA
jgi:hypothetical protein